MPYLTSRFAFLTPRGDNAFRSIAALALILGLATPAFSQEIPPPPPFAAQDLPPKIGTPFDHWQERSFSEADRQAFLDARIAGIRAGLQLTAEQEQLWPQAEAAVRAFALDMRKMHEARHAEKQQWRAMREAGERQSMAGMDILERMRARADRQIWRGQVMKRLIENVSPLYNALTPEQKMRLRHLADMKGWGMSHHMKDWGGMGMSHHMKDWGAKDWGGMGHGCAHAGPHHGYGSE